MFKHTQRRKEYENKSHVSCVKTTGLTVCCGQTVSPGPYHLRVGDQLEAAQLFAGLPHVAFLLRTHVGTRPHERLGQHQVCALGTPCRGAVFGFG